MNNKNINTEEGLIDFSVNQLRDIFTQAGLNSDLTERAIKDYQRYRESELSSLSILTGNEIRQIGAEALAEKILKLKAGRDLVEDLLLQYSRYLEYKEEIIETYQESKDWDKVISSVVYVDIDESQEAFIDFVEETYQTKVKDAKRLQELTGCNEYENTAKVKLEDVINIARYSKYFRALEKTLKEGGKYKDLLQIKPQDFGLPKTWKRWRASDQYSSILWALSSEFLINEPAAVTIGPNLRSIAQELEAPYSVLMDCYNLTNKR